MVGGLGSGPSGIQLRFSQVQFLSADSVLIEKEGVQQDLAEDLEPEKYVGRAP